MFLFSCKIKCVKCDDTQCRIGDNYGGGLIAYIDATEKHGLIVASQDLPNPASWGCKGSVLSANSRAYGKGLENTNIISSLCQDVSTAKRCFDLIQNGYSDWFLPSEIELSYREENLFLQGLGNFSASLPYWSSTESNGTNSTPSLDAWRKKFRGGGLYTDKNGANLIRPCRYF
jgi:hypothetical protein